jgi:hypothetical protein
MIDLFQTLQPRFVKKNIILMEENGEWLEILFFDHGTYMVGFELNR